MIVLSQDKMTTGNFYLFEASNFQNSINGLYSIYGYIFSGEVSRLGDYTLERAKEIILDLHDSLKCNVLNYEMPEN